MLRFLVIGSIAVFISASAAQSQSLRDVFSALAEGRTVPISPASTLIMGGVTDRLTSECDGLAISASDRATLAGFLTRAATRAAIGGSYSDPDLSEALGDQISGMQLYAASGELAFQTLGCGDDASVLLSRIAASVRDGADQGGEGRFVQSCQRQFSRQQCSCLLQIGSSVFPNLANTEYSRDMIYNLVQSNPFLGLMLPMQCGIVEY